MSSLDLSANEESSTVRYLSFQMGSTLLEENKSNKSITSRLSANLRFWATNMLRNVEKVIFPLLLNKNHWVLIIIDLVHSTVSCYDPYHRDQSKYLKSQKIDTLAARIAEVFNKNTSIDDRFDIVKPYLPVSLIDCF